MWFEKVRIFSREALKYKFIKEDYVFNEAQLSVGPSPPDDGFDTAG